MNTKLVVPIITLFQNDGSLDYNALEIHGTNMEKSGAKIFALGTTGEALSLSDEVKRNVISFLTSKFTGVYIGISSNSLDTTLSYVHDFNDNDNIEAFVCHLPTHYQFTDQQVCDYFTYISEASKKPLILYNIPLITHQSLSHDVINVLSYLPNIIGIKDSENDKARLDKSLQMWKSREDFSVYVGTQSLFVHGLLNGAEGIVAGLANIQANWYYALCYSIENNDEKKTEFFQNTINKLGDISKSCGKLPYTIAVIKYIVHLQNGSFFSKKTASNLIKLTPEMEHSVKYDWEQLE